MHSVASTVFLRLADFDVVLLFFFHICILCMDLMLDQVARRPPAVNRRETVEEAWRALVRRHGG